MAITGQTLTKSFIVAGQKLYAADLIGLVDELQALNDELVSECIANAGAQAIDGVKTFSSAPVFSAGAVCGSNKLTAVKDPTANQDAATKKYVDDKATFTPTTYAGEESITFPNGLIFKHGYIARTAVHTTVTFGTAFTTVISGNAVVANQGTDNNAAEIDTLNTTTMIIQLSADVTGYYWQAWGY